MRLEPIRPALRSGQTVVCAGCARMVGGEEIRADLEAPAGTFYCIGCGLTRELAELDADAHPIQSRGIRIQYRGFLQWIAREFDTREDAERWCRQIGRADLIPRITGGGS